MYPPKIENGQSTFDLTEKGKQINPPAESEKLKFKNPNNLRFPPKIKRTKISYLVEWNKYQKK